MVDAVFLNDVFDQHSANAISDIGLDPAGTGPTYPTSFRVLDPRIKILSHSFYFITIDFASPEIGHNSQYSDYMAKDAELTLRSGRTYDQERASEALAQVKKILT